MIRMLVAAPRSGSGKTTVACALLRALRDRGLAPCAFKCGPDYIDPMFHRAALGVESRNLDLFLCGADRLRAQFERACAGHGAAVIEGAMGYYDGVELSDRASAWWIADTLEVPALLVLNARGAGLSLAAEVRGMTAFRERSRIAGVLLNECAPALCRRLAPALERETGVPVLGCLPRLDGARIESRHLGLRTAQEIEDLDERLARLAAALAENVDWERLQRIFSCEKAFTMTEKQTLKYENVRIGIANDKAFCFTYFETLEALRDFGAEIVSFSPLEDAALPPRIAALYLPGGYPELYAQELSTNKSMVKSIKSAVLGGMPTVAECGGFLYLGASLCDPDGNAYPMVGVLPGRAADAGRLVRFGYETLRAEADSLLFRAGERVPAHEFHHWESDACGDGLCVEKGEKSWRCGFVSDTLYAAFPHLFFAGRPALAERFAAAARRFGGKHGVA